MNVIYLLAEAVSGSELGVAKWAFLGILATQATIIIVAFINNRKTSRVAKETREISTQVQGHNGWSQADMMLEIMTTLTRHITKSNEAHEELTRELHALATTIGAHEHDKPKRREGG